MNYITSHETDVKPFELVLADINESGCAFATHLNVVSMLTCNVERRDGEVQHARVVNNAPSVWSS